MCYRLFEYMDRKLLLETPSEQARLLQDCQKVIPEMVDIKLSQEDFPQLEQDNLPELSLEETNKTIGNNSEGGSSACYLNNGTDAAGYSSFCVRVCLCLCLLRASPVFSFGIFTVDV